MNNNRKHTGSLSKVISEREKKNDALARALANEGIVLLKNEGLLPLSEKGCIALLGNGARHTIKGGIGSGDVNNRRSVTIYEGLKNSGALFSSEKWLDEYDDIYESARVAWKEKIYEDLPLYENPFDAYASNPFTFPDEPQVKWEDIEKADTAVYVVSRIAGEGKDRRLKEGDYYLSKQEEANIRFICKSKPLVLIINAGSVVEITELLESESNIKAVLFVSQLGQAGGLAIADVLFGHVNPSGKLTATWARHYMDYPNAAEYSYLNDNLAYDEYKEGIYVGYRYFSTAGIKPLFCFGHGLSYASFNLQASGIAEREGKLIAGVSVLNASSEFAGREVVECYAKMPATGLNKEKFRLIGFAKTDLLKPFQCQLMTITFDSKSLAVFDSAFNEWIVEEGTYGIYIGSSLDKAKLFYEVVVNKTVTIENVHNVLNPIKNIKEIRLDRDEEKLNLACAVPKIDFKPQAEEKVKVSYTNRIDINSENLLTLLYGNVTEGTSHLGCAGVMTPGSAGETSDKLLATHGIDSLIMADGPAGLRLRACYEVDKATDKVYGQGVFGALDGGYLEPMEFHENSDIYYQYCTAFPVGTAIAQTWNTKLLREFGAAVAKEMQEFGVNLWLAPGMNIQKNPLCGRNFEYFSEDPLLTGMCGAAITQGVQSKAGCGVTIKHFACNNQEDNRMGVDSRLSTRALREIYLRGFEIAIKTGKPVAVMSSYNMINGTHAANNGDLCETILREEWGFGGVVMTDWNTTLEDGGSRPELCCISGNDIIMPGNPFDSKAIKEAYANGLISYDKAVQSVNRIISLVNKLQIS